MKFNYPQLHLLNLRKESQIIEMLGLTLCGCLDDTQQHNQAQSFAGKNLAHLCLSNLNQLNRFEIKVLYSSDIKTTIRNDQTHEFAFDFLYNTKNSLHWENAKEISDSDFVYTKRMIIVFAQVWGEFDIDIIHRAMGDKNKIKRMHLSGLFGSLNSNEIIVKGSNGKWKLKGAIPSGYPVLTKSQIEKIRAHARVIAKQSK